MKRFELRFEKSFFIRNGIVVAITLFFTTLPAMVMKNGGLLAWMLPLTALFPLLLPLREWRIAARVIDEEGVTRHDGKRYLWTDLNELREVNFINRYGQTGFLNHLDIYFRTGRARILPLVLRDGYEAILAIKQHHGKPSAPEPGGPKPASVTAPPSLPEPEPAKTGHCSLCGDLGSFHAAMQTHGREHLDTFLPPAVKNLQFVKDVRPGTTRTPELLRCPGCGSWFLFEIGYDYLATGSEDEQRLSRLTPGEAEKIMGE